MAQATHDPAIYSPEAGSFVSQKIQHLAEILKDYDPTLELRWIPSELRSAKDSLPYAVVHSIPGGRTYTVLYFKEEDDPVSILGRIFAGDGAKNDLLRTIEAQEAARQAFQHKKSLDELAEAADQMHFLMTTRSKNWVNWKDLKTGKIVKLDSNRRRVK